MQGTASPLASDRPLATRAGRYTIQLTKPGPDVFRVEVLRGGPVARPVDALSRSFEFYGLAYAIYRTLERALAMPGATVKTAQRAVVKHIDAEIALLVPSALSVLKAEVLQNVRAGFADDLAVVAS